MITIPHLRPTNHPHTVARYFNATRGLKFHSLLTQVTQPSCPPSFICSPLSLSSRLVHLANSAAWRPSYFRMQHTFGIIFSSFLPSISPHLTAPSFAAVAAAKGGRATHFCASGIHASPAAEAAAAMGNIYLSKKASARAKLRVHGGEAVALKCRRRDRTRLVFNSPNR